MLTRVIHYIEGGVLCVVFVRGIRLHHFTGVESVRGSVILYRNSFSLQNHWSDTKGRLVLAEFAIRELSFRVLCVYAPNRFIARNDFLEGCADVVDPGIPTFILADFNTVSYRLVDRRG